VRTLRSEVPEELDALVLRLLEKDPADRPADAAEVAGLLVPLALAPAPRAPANPGDPTIPLREQVAASSPQEESPPLPPTEVGAVGLARDGGFDIFDVHRRLISDYRGFTEGAAVIRDDRIAAFVEQDLDAKSQWPDPWLSLNPSFADGGSVADLADT